MCIAHDMLSTTSRKMMNECFILCVEGTKMILTNKHNTVHKGAVRECFMLGQLPEL